MRMQPFTRDQSWSTIPTRDRRLSPNSSLLRGGRRLFSTRTWRGGRAIPPPEATTATSSMRCSDCTSRSMRTTAQASPPGSVIARDADHHGIGDARAFDVALPVLQAFGSRVHYLGPAGSGPQMKGSQPTAVWRASGCRGRGPGARKAPGPAARSDAGDPPQRGGRLLDARRPGPADGRGPVRPHHVGGRHLCKGHVTGTGRDTRGATSCGACACCLPSSAPQHVDWVRRRTPP